jgi:ParB-like chromosome segregation protein Spo0J
MTFEHTEQAALDLNLPAPTTATPNGLARPDQTLSTAAAHDATAAPPAPGPAAGRATPALATSQALAAHADLLTQARALFDRLGLVDEQTRIDLINALKVELHERSPLRGEPVDCVVWVRADTVAGNDYNPNVVAPPELELLRHSIHVDGYTQPIVAFPVDESDADFEVVDGFHRHLVGKDDPTISARIHCRLPIAVINAGRAELPDRMAATVRHNRARGQHAVAGMADMVVSLSRRGKSDEWIGQELGMAPDEVLRLRQTTGIAAMFADEEFSEAWEDDGPAQRSAAPRRGQT